MTVRAWLTMLLRNGFRIAPRRWYLVLLITAASVVNSTLALVQRLALGRRIDRTELPPDPLFILGHWRSGTTLLHELLGLDARHACPSTYACLAPSHFLISQRLLAPWLRWLLPARRSQDDVVVGFEQAQEDEWALCALGLPSLYQTAAFPNRDAHDWQYADLEGLVPAVRRRWISAWTRLLRCVALGAPGKRLVIKSPLHLARIEAALEVFPDARFVHIVREPQAVFASTLRLWQRLAEDEGLQAPQADRLRPFVLENYVRAYESFERQCSRIPPGRLCQVRYEDLVADPVGQVRRIYEHLDLGGFDAVRPMLEMRALQAAGFRTNRLSLSPEEARLVKLRWGPLAAKFGGYGREGELCAA